jgi:hypothetical protein
MKLKEYTISKFGTDWYHFGDIPQGHLYITVNNLRQSSDKKALKTAKGLNPNFKYVIKEKKNDSKD